MLPPLLFSLLLEPLDMALHNNPKRQPLNGKDRAIGICVDNSMACNQSHKRLQSLKNLD